jgi:rRNA maturation endonuclease Nob1
MASVYRSMDICPYCGAADPKSLGQVRSTLEWFHCSWCRKVWADRPPGDLCEKCGGHRTVQVTGRSLLPPTIRKQCSACGHSTDVES